MTPTQIPTMTNLSRDTFHPTLWVSLSAREYPNWKYLKTENANQCAFVLNSFEEFLIFCWICWHLIPTLIFFFFSVFNFVPFRVRSRKGEFPKNALFRIKPSCLIQIKPLSIGEWTLFRNKVYSLTFLRLLQKKTASIIRVLFYILLAHSHFWLFASRAHFFAIFHGSGLHFRPSNDPSWTLVLFLQSLKLFGRGGEEGSELASEWPLHPRVKEVAVLRKCHSAMKHICAVKAIITYSYRYIHYF